VEGRSKVAHGRLDVLALATDLGEKLKLLLYLGVGVVDK
jgi:hypothetical protein